MAIDNIVLPKNKAQLARILARHAARCEHVLMYRRTNWLLCWYYMNGYRRFNVFDPSTGQLTPHMLDEQGNMEYQSTQLLYDINQVAGRIQSMDLRPKVVQQGFSLAGQRNMALSQVIDDSIFSDDQIRGAAESWSWLFACLGFAGITGHVVDHPTIGLTADLEVIHPKELFPFPLVGQDPTKARGVMRQRWIPITTLQDVYGKSKISSLREDMEWYEVEAGESWNEREDAHNVVWHTNREVASYSTNEVGGGGEYLKVVKVRELWLEGPRGTCSRYVITSGDACIDDQDLEGTEVYCPIGYARFMNNGTWHGAGMFDLQFSTHRQLEMLSKSLYNNIMSLDRYGVLVLPQGNLPANDILREIGHGLKVMFWDPDPVAEGFNPFPIQPYNSGDLPGRVAQFAREALQSVNPIQDLLKEKGRVDSATGLQFLDEQITRALTSPTMGVQKAWGDMYRATTQKALAHLSLSRRSIPVGALTLDLAGAVIDHDSNTVSFRDNPIPDLSRLSFTVRDVSPRSVVARKQEAVQLWQLKIQTDPLAFRLFALKENLDFAMWLDEDAGAYEMGIRAILSVYNDGETPGQLILTPYTTRPEIVIRLFTAFVTGPKMQVASPEVFNAMMMLRDTLMSYMGLVLPSAIPNPDDAAMLSVSMAGQLPQGSASGAPAGSSKGSSE